MLVGRADSEAHREQGLETGEPERSDECQDAVNEGNLIGRVKGRTTKVCTFRDSKGCRPLPALRPKRAAYGVADLRFGSGLRDLSQ